MDRGTPDDFGPVPISALKREAGEVFAALRAGRHVLVSRRSEVVGVIDPVEALADDALVQFVRRSDASRELTATTINQGSPSAALDAADGGERTPLTHHGRLLGMMRAVGDADVERAVGGTAATTPAATEDLDAAGGDGRGDEDVEGTAGAHTVTVLDGDTLMGLLADGAARPRLAGATDPLDRAATDLAADVARLIEQARGRGMDDAAVRGAVADALSSAMGDDVTAWVGTGVAPPAAGRFDPGDWEIAAAFDPTTHGEGWPRRAQGHLGAE